MRILTEAEMIARYDAMKDGSLYIKPADDEIEIAEEIDRCCANGTPDRDCAACTAKYEAERQQVHARATAAPTMRERVDILLEGSEVPNGDQLFDLLLEDRVAHYLFLRTVDWVLWRQAHGKPVKTLAQPDQDSAIIDARFDAARALSKDITNYGPHTSEDIVHILCAGEMIERWERTPEQEAQIQRTNDLLISVLQLIDGGE